jgi:hypothetical protein
VGCGVRRSPLCAAFRADYYSRIEQRRGPNPVRAHARRDRSNNTANTTRCCTEPRLNATSPRQARTGPSTANRTTAPTGSPIAASRELSDLQPT